jgi:hypothetical protein
MSASIIRIRTSSSTKNMDAWPSTLAVACGAIESGFVHHENYSRTQSIAR